MYVIDLNMKAFVPVNIRIPRDMHKACKMHAADLEQTMADFIRDSIGYRIRMRGTDRISKEIDAFKSKRP